MSLDEFLGPDDGPEEAAASEAVAPKEEQPAEGEGDPEDRAPPEQKAKSESAEEKGNDEATGEDDAPPAASSAKPDGRTAPLASLLEERKKRQALERRLAELEGGSRPQPQTQAAEQQPSGQAEDNGLVPFDWSDVEGSFTKLQQRSLERLQRIEAKASAKVQEVFEEAAREKYKDYDEVIGELSQVAASDPVLHAQYGAQIRNSRNPAVTAYKLGVAMRKFRGVTDLGEYEKQIAERVAKETEAKLRKSLALEAAENAPKSLARARGVGNSTKAEPEPYDRDEDFDEILQKRRR